MSALLLRLSAPLQSWGDSSRFTRRETRAEPTKSGVIGLLAAAEGRRRTDQVEDLVRLRFGVRVDQEGRLTRDFQTAQRWDTGDRMPLSYRYYLADAVFVAGVEGPVEVLHGLADSLRRPVFPLYLGRRSCPPSTPLLMHVVDNDLDAALREAPWQAAGWYRRTMPRRASLRLVMDAQSPGAHEDEVVRDVPLSYSPERREYGWRSVANGAPVVFDNVDGHEWHADRQDFFGAVSSA